MGEPWIAAAALWLEPVRAALSGSPLVVALVATNVVAAILWQAALAKARSARRRTADLEAARSEFAATYERETTWRLATAQADVPLTGARTTIDG